MKNRSYEEFMQELKQRAACYVPQWRMDEENPDLGTALARAFAGMQYDTEKKGRELTEKWQTEFFNCLHTCVKGPVAASGYTNFQLVNDQVEGVELPAGTALTSPRQGEDGEQIPVETQDDVYVCPSELDTIYESWDERDYIACLWNRGEEKPAVLFDYSRENLQNHELYLGFSLAVAAERAEEIALTLQRDSHATVHKSVLQRLLQVAEFSYSGADGSYHSFAHHEVRDGRIVFYKSGSQPAWAPALHEELECCWLRCQLPRGSEFENLEIWNIGVSTRSFLSQPQRIYADDTDVAAKTFMPFGDQPSIYDEVYFADDEVLQKAGAAIELSFIQEFQAQPIGPEQEQEVNWKLIMRRGDVQPEEKFDITVSRVIWEYYNGNGWVNLFADHGHEDAFSPEHGRHRQKISLRFTCPDDMAQADVNGEEIRCIRARILKMENAYKTSGQYILPVLSETAFSYDYQQETVAPQWVVTYNSCRTKIQSGESCLGGAFSSRFVELAGDRLGTVYLGFSNPLTKGPVRMLAVLDTQDGGKMPPLNWQYYSSSGWKDLSPADQTESLSQTGLVSFQGLPDMAQTEQFGVTKYWIRLQDIKGRYGSLSRRNLPVLQGLYLNSVRVKTVRRGQEENFTLETYQPEAKFQLLQYPVHHVQVWVNEQGNLSTAERNDLAAAGRLRLTENEEEPEAWVLWRNVESFTVPAQDGRGYVLNEASGTLIFSCANGFQMPPVGVSGGIQVQFSVGGGACTNLRAHEITGLELSAGFINQVDNPLPLAGGCGSETADQAMARAASQIRHGFRAVTASDYENLALGFSQTIQRVKCFPGHGADGSRKSGHVTLVVMPRDPESSGRFFQELRNQLFSYLQDKVPAGMIGGNRFHIVMPQFVSVQVSMEVYVRDFNAMFGCEQKIREKLAEFLNPVTGNFSGNGFEIGRLPGRQQIDMVLKDVAEIKEIKNLVVTGVIRRGNEEVEVSLSGRQAFPYVLPENGSHQIIMKTL